MDSPNLSPDLASLPCAATGKACQLLEELLQLREQVSDLRHQAQTDALTGLYNFRFFSNLLPLEMERSRRSYQPLSLVILDIDHFKQFNDRWGHELGNQALTHIAQLISTVVRKLDFACRFGGEEFAIVLPNTDLSRALNVAERLRTVIAQTPLETAQGTITLTASLGVDEFLSTSADTPAEFIARADNWLYQAKAAGRNCVKGAQEPTLVTSVTVSADEKEALFDLFQDSNN